MLFDLTRGTDSATSSGQEKKKTDTHAKKDDEKQKEKEEKKDDKDPTEEELKLKLRVLGNIRFIGELFKLRMLPVPNRILGIRKQTRHVLSRNGLCGSA